MTRSALLLIAHGSKDPAWKRPFEAIAERLAKTAEGPVVLTYLESACPSVPEGLTYLMAQEPQQVLVAPLFLAGGRHARIDIPELMKQMRSEHPQVHWQLLPTIGELPAVQEAIASAVLTQLDGLA